MIRLEKVSLASVRCSFGFEIERIQIFEHTSRERDSRFPSNLSRSSKFFCYSLRKSKVYTTTAKRSTVGNENQTYLLDVRKTISIINSKSTAQLTSVFS